MRKIALVCFVFMQGLLAFGQERGKITVVVVNGKQAALENATVELLKAKDSSLVKAAVTDAVGVAEFEQMPWNSYLVRISMVNHNSVYSSPFNLSAETPDFRLPSIALIPKAASTMREVT